jgi:hypothetical protein
MSIYIDEGYKGREDYLLSLAEEFELDAELVFELAKVLGESEDFDGLVVTLEDHSEGL